MVVASKVPMLKPDVYEIWRMSIKQYIQMIDYALWKVIENGETLPITKVIEGVMTEIPIISAEEKAQRRLEVKTRSTLMMGIPNELQLKFNSIKDPKKLLEAVEKSFGRNVATKKTQRNLLKQQYENFTRPWSVPMETFTSTALVSCDGLGGYEWSDHAEEGPNYKLMAFSSSCSDLKEISCLQHLTCLLLGLEEFVNKHVVENCKAKSSEEEPKDQRVIDSGCSRHMTGNMSYLTYFKEINRGYVAFGGNPKGEKGITYYCWVNVNVKENQEKDKIRSKPDKNGKRVEAGKSLK
nr:hypothetical protein [Tanacetum cinerariifolium]